MTRNYLDILADTIRTNWDQPALTDFYLTEDGTAQDTSRGNHYTYGGMYAELCRVAELLTSLGLQKGDHIAICGANSAHWVIAYLAIAKMQGVSVTVMHSLMPDEIARLVNFSDAKALFTDEDIWAELSPSLEGRVGERFISLADWSLLDGCSDRAMSERRPREDREITFPSFVPDDLAMICFTSGTTGKAKGVMLSHRSANVGVRDSSQMLLDCKNKNYISLLPLTHISGLFVDVIDQLLKAKNVFIYRGYRISEAIKCVRPYVLTLVPILVEQLLVKEKLKPEKIGIQCVYIGGAKITQSLIDVLSNQQISYVILYAATEGLLFSYTSPYCKYQSGNVGKICESLQCRISPVGEILVKGENVMLGYYKDPEATAAKIDSDGWLHTGDKGHLDEDGYLYVEGRLEQDIIVLPNGENIRPDNIESLINALPEVRESIVLARDGKLVTIVVPNPSCKEDNLEEFSRKILYAVNPQLPLYSQLYGLEISKTPLARTEKQTIKRYLYK